MPNTSEIVKAYLESLEELTVNSKPQINMLTMLAEDNIEHAPSIVQTVEKHLLKVPADIKLPVLYLIDSIVKNVGQSYISLFTLNLVSTFCGVFEKVDERTRAQMFKLRQTWNDVFPATKLYTLDVRVSEIDPAWPISSPVPPPRIHVNPIFIKQKAANSGPQNNTASQLPVTSHTRTGVSREAQCIPDTDMKDQLLKKEKELIELQHKKLELELLQAKTKLIEQVNKQQCNLKTEHLQQILSTTLTPVAFDSKILLAQPKLAKPTILPQKQGNMTTPVSSTVVSNSSSVSAAKSANNLTPLTSSVPVATEVPAVSGRTKVKDPGLKPTATVTRPRDPRLASRIQTSSLQSSTKVLPMKQCVTADKPESLSKDNKNSVLDSIKTDASKPKSNTFNIANKDIVNKESRPVSKKDPRLLSNKVNSVNTKVKLGSVLKGSGSKSRSSPPKSSVLHPNSPIQSIKSPKKPSAKSSSSSSSSKFLQSKNTFQTTDNSESLATKTPEVKIEANSGNNIKSTLLENTSKINFANSKGEKKKSQEGNKKQSPSDKKRSNSKSTDPSTVVNKRGKSPRKLDLFEIDKDSPSPPPPPIISETREHGSPSGRTSTKEVASKTSKKRSNVRRERQEETNDSEVSPKLSQDVDLRVQAPPEKHPRLAEADEPTTKPLIDAATKDVDFRNLPRSPSKKRPSLERGEQPPVKKSKAEIIDVLFGNEDVDLRQLAPLPAPLPSPPPPPIISQVSPPPSLSTSSSQDSCINMPLSPRPSNVDLSTNQLHDNDNTTRENGEHSWAKYKESKPDTYKSPLPLRNRYDDKLTNLESPRRDELPYPTERENRIHFIRNPDRPIFDRLGRPLLYHRLPDDPGERKRSFSKVPSFPGEDTDMRTPLLDACAAEDMDMNMNTIIAQAEEQLRNGSLTIKQYNTLLQQVIQLNEMNKLREAQRRDEQENRESWDRSRRKLANITSSSHELSKQGRNSPLGSKFGDIDERFPVKPMPPMTKPSLHSPPEVLSLGGSSVPQPWMEVAHPQSAAPPRISGPTSGSWDTRPPPWMRGGPPPGPLHPNPHMRMVHPNQPPPFLRPPGLDFLPPGPNNYPSIQRWRLQQFNNRPPPPQDGDIENRFERFSSRSDSRLPLRPPVHSQQTLPSHAQQPPPSLTSHYMKQELPPADPMILDHIAQDSMRTINIDNIPREIRFYGDTAIVMLSWDDPREITFQGGSRRVIIDDSQSIVCNFNDSYREIMVDGQSHSIRLGSPTRELYIDGKWYECFFGGPPVNVELGGKIRMIKLEGPAPQVKIGFIKRTDLVAGKINLIIDARNMVPIFLDAKPQRFDIENKPHILRFVNALTTVLINGRPFKVEFGGLPKPIVVRDKKHFIRFSVLPRGIRPGYVNIINMEGGRLPSPPLPETENSDSTGFHSGPDDSNNEDPNKFSKGHEPVLPMLGRSSQARLRKNFGADRDSPHDQEQARNSPSQLSSDNASSGPVGEVSSVMKTKPGGQLPLEMLTSLMPAATAPAAGFSYQVEQDSQETKAQQSVVETVARTSVVASETTEVTTQATAASATTTSTNSTVTPFLNTDINIAELFKKLVATGIVPNIQANVTEEKKEEETNAIKPVDLQKPETLKVRQPGLVAALYSGIQCSSCGVRFPPEQTMKYSQHLDWHFRQNRRDRDNTRKAQSRKWYYDVSDWIQFEEIEDLEERAQSWFETQQATEGRPEESEPVEIPSVPAGENPEDNQCDVCHDKFEQFYNEETEEWHLRLAIRVEDKTYHPLCFEDLKTSLEEPPTDGSEVPLEDLPLEEEKETVNELETKSDNKDSPTAEIKDEGNEETAESENKSRNDDNEKFESENLQIKIETENMKNDMKEESDMSTDINFKEENELEEHSIETEPDIKQEKDEEEEVVPTPVVDTTLTEVACTIDGNVQFEDAPQLGVSVNVGPKIKINITKPLIAIKETVPVNDVGLESVDCKMECTHVESTPEVPEKPMETNLEPEDPEPPPPGVEPVQLKPRLVGRKLTELPPVMKGSEMSGLCSIM